MTQREQLITYLSSEVETLASKTLAFRGTAAFTIWVGPFIILGSVIVATKAGLRAPSGTAVVLPAIAATLAYIALGLCGGLVELGAWHRCNVLRSLIIELSPDAERAVLEERLLDRESEKYVVWTYLLVFVFVWLAFVAVYFFATAAGVL